MERLSEAVGSPAIDTLGRRGWKAAAARYLAAQLNTPKGGTMRDILVVRGTRLEEILTEAEYHRRLAEGSFDLDVQVLAHEKPYAVPLPTTIAELFGLRFEPPPADLLADRSDKLITVLAGANNSGKSLFLKRAHIEFGLHACYSGTNRFYHLQHLSYQKTDASVRGAANMNFLRNVRTSANNLDSGHFQLGRYLSYMSSKRRRALFDLFEELMGMHVDTPLEDSSNDLSPRLVQVDGLPLASVSSGTRLLLSLLAMLFDEEVRLLLIDEPELGLSPALQGTLSALLFDEPRIRREFPHIRQIVIATHSNIFLRRDSIGDNFLVVRKGVDVRLRQIGSFVEFNDLQFSMLGNRLDTMFLPSAIVLAEGPTDRDFLSRVFSLVLPNDRVSVVNCGGDGNVLTAARFLRLSLGDLHRSPYANRIFAVLDSRHSSSLSRLEANGVPRENIIVWPHNGIEFVYPHNIMAEIFGVDKNTVASVIQLDGDRIRVGSTALSKTDLCSRILAQLNAECEWPDSLTTLIQQVRARLGQ